MLVVIRNGENVSLKTMFILSLLSEDTKESAVRIYRKQSNRFMEEYCGHEINLRTAVFSNFAYILTSFIKSPQDIRGFVVERLLHKKTKGIINKNSFLSNVSEVLFFFFATKASIQNIKPFLAKLENPIFMVDEFWSVKSIDQRTLKGLGKIVYVSQDLAYNRYGFSAHMITRNLMYRLERDLVANADLVIACSERERISYVEMGAKKAIYYPNIYPIEGFEPQAKERSPSISIIFREHWGDGTEKALSEIFKALSFIGKRVNVCFFGQAPKFIPKNIHLLHYSYVPNKMQYLEILSRSWIGINIGFHLSGTNERKYDYAMAGLVVFSDNLGTRGDLLPHEITFVDSYDLAAKLKQIFDLGYQKIIEMGRENRRAVLHLADKQRQTLLHVSELKQELC